MNDALGNYRQAATRDVVSLCARIPCSMSITSEKGSLTGLLRVTKRPAHA
jgi:hypothetical protein